MTDQPIEKSAATASEFLVNGMTCQNCARHVTEAIQSVPGVRSATVDLQSQRAAIRWLPETTPESGAVITAIQKAGYKARLLEPMEAGHAPSNFSGWQWTLLLAVICTLPMMLGEWGFSLAMSPWFQWLEFGLASVVQVFVGAPFYRGAWNQLKIPSSNMDTLVVLGSTTAFAFSVWTLFQNEGGHVFFMESASIITLVSAGHWLEARVSVRASSALRELLNLAPQTARRIRTSPVESPTRLNLLAVDFKKSSAVEEEVSISVLKAGDLVALRPGDQVPVDGEVVQGQSAVNEGMLTGESLPMDKAPGSKLFAGTVNLNGRLLMRVVDTGEQTALAHIIAAVQRAQTSRARIQRIGDRVSSVFVPVVIGIALSAALCWGLLPDSAKSVHTSLAGFLPWHARVPNNSLAAAFIIAASVLIIACPCAMGLATPAAIMASANAAARQGILIRDGVALEKAGEVTAVIFDKTGTLTTGKAEVVKVWTRSGPGEVSPNPSAFPEVSDEIKFAAALARNSTHPISEAIAKLSPQNIYLTGWQEFSGRGVQAHDLLKGRMRLGSLRWLSEAGLDWTAGQQFIAEWSAQGATLVGLTTQETLLALFAVKDAVKPGAAHVIKQLHDQGLKTFMLTGDQALTAASIAASIGINGKNVFAEIRPEQKADFVKKLQAQGERVAFVGDGINDAPALEQADLGIAVSRASDVARAAADIILMKSDIAAVPECLGLARATLRTIKQNLFWAFFYNALGVPLAALGFMSPILCAAAMGLSDLIVIGNALRLAKWRGNSSFQHEQTDNGSLNSP